MGVKPVFTIITLYCERYGQCHHPFHFFLQYAFHHIYLVMWDVKQQFIMYLKNHHGFESFLPKTAVHRYHRQLYYVGRSALNRCIHGISFRKCPKRPVGGLYLRNISPSPEKRLHIHIVSGLFHGLRNKPAHRRKTLEIIIDNPLGLRSGTMQTLSKSERRYSVYNPEINCFGHSSLLLGHLVQRHSEYF